MRGRGRFATLCLRRQPRHRLVDGRCIGGNHQFLERQAIDLDGVDGRQHLHLDGQRHIGTVADLAGDIDLWLVGGAQGTIAQQLLDAVIDRGLQRFAAQRLAVHLADQVRRHLPGPEPRHADRLGHYRKPRIDACRQRGRGNDQRIFAAQALVQRFGDLHVSISTLGSTVGTTYRARPAAAFGAGEGTRTPTSFDTGT